MSLPVLWVAKTVENPRPNTAHSFYQLAYFQREHDTEHLYIPAQRIRELIDGLDEWIWDPDPDGALGALVKGLERLMEGE